jgi:hypothetical protein
MSKNIDVKKLDEVVLPMLRFVQDYDQMMHEAIGNKDPETHMKMIRLQGQVTMTFTYAILKEDEDTQIINLRNVKQAVSELLESMGSSMWMYRDNLVVIQYIVSNILDDIGAN